MLWVGIGFLGLMALDIWNRPKTKHKTRNLIFMVVEGIAAIWLIGQWIIGRL